MNTDMICTGSDYIASLRGRKLDVWLFGERVEEVGPGYACDLGGAALRDQTLTVPVDCRGELDVLFQLGR